MSDNTFASTQTPRPDAHVAARVEELLREQLFEIGVNPASLSPHDIIEHMTCALAPDNSMTYAWKGQALLHVTPEIHHDPEGECVRWRMFTTDDTPAHVPSTDDDADGNIDDNTIVKTAHKMDSSL